MRTMHLTYPHYGWEHNKGYATEFHRAVIAEHGVTPEHRMSFRHCTVTQLELFEDEMFEVVATQDMALSAT